jgi:sugar phosphate isomerase/epimerase
VKLSLSVRIAESLTNKETLTLPFAQVLRLASEIGYVAICSRGSVVSVTSPPDHVDRVVRLIREHGLAVSMVTGDVTLAVNDAHAVDALRSFTPYLDLAQALGTTRLRVMLQSEADIPFAQRAADEANERGMLLCHQTHQCTLCETVGESLEVVRRVNRRNFGITYEPANLLICGDDYGPESIKRLGERIFNVYLQNFQVTPDGATEQPTNRGIVRATPLPLGDKRGVDLDRIFEGLRAIDYAGWVTVHSAMVPGLTVEQSARQYFDVLAPYVAR